jgi:DNA-binding XRE family transcriptional regulator
MPKILEIAKSFGMNVKQLAASIGYTRQALYYIENDTIDPVRYRIDIAYQKLNEMSIRMMEDALKKAEEDFHARNRLVDEFFKLPDKIEDNRTIPKKAMCDVANLHREILAMPSAAPTQKRCSRAWLVGHGFKLGGENDGKS